MIALKMLLMVVGMLVVAGAFAMPLYRLWMRLQQAQRRSHGDI